VSDGVDDAGTAGAPSNWAPPVDPTASGSTSAPYQPAPGAATPQWTPPSQPGLVPLRPMTLGTLLGASFRTLRRNPRPLLGLALSTQMLVGILTVAVMVGSLFAMFSRLETVSAENVDEVTAGSIFGIVLANLVPMLLGAAVVALLQGVVVLEVSRAVLGEKLTLRQLWAKARGRFWALIGWTLLLVAATVLVIAVLGGLIALLVVLMGAVGVAIGVAVGILGSLGFVVLAAWVGTKLSLVPSVLMVERRTLGAAIRRSWQLTDGFFWRTFGVQLLVAVILSVAMQVISTPISFLLPMLAFIIDPNGTNEGLAIAVLLGVYVLLLAIIVAMSAIAMVVQSATNGLIYIDLRMRKEGLELDLSRFVEQRDAGSGETDDPYLPSSRQGTARGWQATPGQPAWPTSTTTTPASESPWA
jgi:membrane-anchored glycerophosphoryl diester phosphodiesterase (GDPDase)